MSESWAERLAASVGLPEREVVLPHRCMCALTNEAGIVRDRCCAWAEDPDSPLCHSCVMSGHDALPHVPYAEIRLARERGEGL